MALCSSPVSHILRFMQSANHARDNYENWSVCMKNYLLGQGHWDVIEEKGKPKQEFSETWIKKNALALLSIQNSCDPDVLSQIREITSAKVAWDTLAKIYEPEPSTVTVNPGDPVNPHLQLPAVNQGIQNIDCSQFKSLLEAINKGDWDLVGNNLAVMPEAITAKITYSDETPLHVATTAGHLKIVENLVELMSEEDLEIQDENGHTALAAAAMYRSTKIAECIIRKNKNLLTIIDKTEKIPLILACSYGHKDLIQYLYSVTPLEFLLQPENDYCASDVLCYFIDLRMFDLALDLLSHCPRLTTVRCNDDVNPLISLSLRPIAFPSGCRLVFWQRWIYSCIRIQLPAASDIRVNIPQEIQKEGENNRVQVLCKFRKLVSTLLELFGIKQIYDMKLMHKQTLEVLRCMSEEISALDIKNAIDNGVPNALFNAANQGIVEFIIEIIKANSNLMFVHDKNGRGIFHFVIENRQEKIFSLLYGLGSRKARVLSNFDNSNNNELHVAGMIAPSYQLNRISGAALQMQRELQWFKEVENIGHPSSSEYLNNDNETPRQVFSRNHKDLVKEGEKWMKETATSCTVVGALIMTIMFAAAFTAPGGNDQNTGLPILLHKKLFMVFIISDAISLFASSTSVLMFLGILTSRYAEDDFLKSLPTKLIIGLSTLFFSIAAMMVAFSAALLIMLKTQLHIAIPIISLAGVPIILFILLQFPLLVEIFMSTYGPSIFDRKMKSWL